MAASSENFDSLAASALVAGDGRAARLGHLHRKHRGRNLGHRGRRRLAAFQHVTGKLAQRDRVAIGHQHRALDRVGQFADVAGP